MICWSKRGRQSWMMRMDMMVDSSEAGTRVSELFDLLMDQEAFQYHEPGETFFMWNRSETEKLSVSSHHHCFHIPDLDAHWPISKISFLRKDDYFNKCADHAVFVYDEKRMEWSLHIIEMKTTIGNDTWLKAVRQFQGALLRAYAIAGLMQFYRFLRIYTYCAFPNLPPSLIDEKANRGGLGRHSKEYPWDKETIKLEKFPGLEVHNRSIRLDSKGRGEIPALQV